MWFICILKAYFDLSILERDFQQNGYHLIRADHPSDTKQGGVCIYHEESLGVPLQKIFRLQSIYRLKVPCKIVKDILGLSKGVSKTKQYWIWKFFV